MISSSDSEPTAEETRDFYRVLRASILAALAATLLLAACSCSLMPSGWWIGGTPLDKTAAAKKQQAAAESAAVDHARAAVHKAETALEFAPAENRPVSVAHDFVTQARSLLDQSQGAPSAAEVATWRDLVMRLLSDNAAVRSAAEKQRAADLAATGDLARKLAAATVNAERANERALGYARDREALADFAAKLKIGFFLLVGLLSAGTLLSVAARFFPQFGLAAKVVNGVIAPGITFAAHRAQVGLQRVGQGFAKFREVAGAGAETLIEQSFDRVITDPDHRQEISAAASAAGNPPPK